MRRIPAAFSAIALVSVWLLIQTIPALASQAPDGKRLMVRADAVLAALADRDFGALADLVHESRGLCVSPYVRDLPELFIVRFSREQVAGFGKDEREYSWGNYDGIGDPIRLTPGEFFSQFVYDMDYAARATRSLLSSRKVADSSLRAINRAYPKASIVLYHFAGTEEIGFKDARDLVMIFSLIDSEWFLIGLAHGEDTI